MTKISRLFFITMMILCSKEMFGQVPQGFTYQAVACDQQGIELVNQQVRVRISILKDGLNGAPQWIENHVLDAGGNVLKTDQFGLFSINIGQGVQQTGGSANSFDLIDWSYGNLWMKVELDPTGGSNFVLIGANRIWSVPYAIYAKRAESAKNADNALNAQVAATATDDNDKNPSNELQDLKWDPATQTLSLVPSGQGNASQNLSGLIVNHTLNYDQTNNSLTLGPNGNTVTISDNDRNPTNELQQLVWDPIAKTLSLQPGGSGTSVVGIPEVGDASNQNELQTLSYDPGNQVLTLSPGLNGQPSTVTINDADKDPVNEIQSLAFDPATNKITLSAPAGSTVSPSTITLDDADKNPTNELQNLTYDSISQTLKIFPAPSGSSGEVRISLNNPGNNEYPNPCGKFEYKVIFGSYTVPSGKVLFITAAGENISLVNGSNVTVHPNSPAMPVIPAGQTINDCNCTAFLTDVCSDWTPVVINLNDPALLANGYVVPAGKVFVVKSGIAINKGVLDVSVDNGAGWNYMEVALSPYEAASRAPAFPAGTRIRKPFIQSTMVLTGYLINE